jgi:hypothetical protein
LTDNRGPHYDQVAFDAETRVVGRGDRAPSMIGMQIREILVYPVPQSGLESLRLELPASAYGGQGAFRFLLPRAIIKDLEQVLSPPRGTP